jgi:hypothetical protein
MHPMDRRVGGPTVVPVDPTGADDGRGDKTMHPTFTHDLARIKISEQMQYAERQRRARAAVASRPRSIDAVSLGGRVRQTLLRLGHATRGVPAGAGA